MEPILIQTKLHRPQTSANLVERPYLLQKLNQNQKRPLTLIIAPAGYGKSTLASNWLETLDCPNAWVSLDENDNDLAGFLSYFIAAIQPFVETGTELASMLNQLASQGVAPEYIAQILANIPKTSKSGNNGTEDNSQTPGIQADLKEKLTYRERDVLSLLALTMSNQEIASSLTISPYTVKRHTTNIYRKLDVKNRRQAVSKAEALGIIQPD